MLKIGDKKEHNIRINMEVNKTQEIINACFEYVNKFPCIVNKAEDCSVYHFMQARGSTAAYTTVIVVDTYEHRQCFVFFDSRHAYSISDPKRLFFDDLFNQNMRPVYQSGCYVREEGN